MPLTMRMNGDQDERARKMVAVSLGLGSARSSWRVMRGVRRLLYDKNRFSNMQIDETLSAFQLYEEWQKALPVLRELIILKLEENIKQGYIVEKHQQTSYSYDDTGKQHISSEKTWEIKMPIPRWMRKAVKEYRQQFPKK